MTVEFLLTALIVVLIPGTGVIYTLSVALTRGYRASLYAALGCTLGIVPAMLASIVGLAAILHTSALVFQLVKFLGVAYLLYLAVVMWQQSDRAMVPTQARPLNAGKILLDGMLINILNSKLTLFFLAFLPQFVSVTGTAAIWMMLNLGLIFMLMTLLVFCLYGLLAHGLRRAFIDARFSQWLQRSFAMCLAGMGINSTFGVQISS